MIFYVENLKETIKQIPTQQLPVTNRYIQKDYKVNAKTNYISK